MTIQWRKIGRHRGNLLQGGAGEIGHRKLLIVYYQYFPVSPLQYSSPCFLPHTFGFIVSESIQSLVGNSALQGDGHIRISIVNNI